MALLFEIRLSSPQIDMLRAFSLDCGLDRVFPHFITHARILLREGLLKWEAVADPTKRAAWSITEKGRLVLKIVDIELAEAKDGQQKLLARASEGHMSYRQWLEGQERKKQERRLAKEKK